MWAPLQMLLFTDTHEPDTAPRGFKLDVSHRNLILQPPKADTKNSLNTPKRNNTLPNPTTMNGYGAANGANGPSGPVDTSVTAVPIPAGPTNQPKVLVRALQKDETTFHLSGVDLAFANSLRRTMMADVPTIGACGVSAGGPTSARCSLPACVVVVETNLAAIDQVSFYQNTSPIPDEMLAHRLGMVPLVSHDAIKGLKYTRVGSTKAESTPRR